MFPYAYFKTHWNQIDCALALHAQSRAEVYLKKVRVSNEELAQKRMELEKAKAAQQRQFAKQRMVPRVSWVPGLIPNVHTCATLVDL